MESLFNYASDEDTQEKDEEELDANYDQVAMDMSSDDEAKSPELETKTCLSNTVESSEFSCSDSISCSSDGSHGMAATNMTRSQSLIDENNRARKRKARTEEVGRLSPCSSTSTNSKKSRYHSSHDLGDQRSTDNRNSSSTINRHHYNESNRSGEKASHQGSSTRYTSSHSRRYSREWDSEKRYRSGESPSRSSDEKSESRTSVQNSTIPVQKLIGDHASQVTDYSRDLKLPNSCNRNAAYPTKYADQAQKRKLLWSGERQGTGCESRAENKSNHWQDAKFSQDTDGRLRAKFKRLMGMKATEAEAQVESTSTASSNELIKKQEEMFNSMEMQYEVARVSTHTHRGLGLGFGVHQFPR